MRRNHLPTVTMPSLRTNRPTDPANSGLFVLFQEISGSIRLGGGPGRTRTSNQTIMSRRARLLAACFSILMDAPECGALVGPGERNALEQEPDG